MKKKTLILELSLIYIFPPLLVVSDLLPKVSIMPMLWLLTLYAFINLQHTKVKLFSFDFNKKEFLYIIRRFLIITLIIIPFVLFYQRDIFLIMPLEKPIFWLGLLIFYPIFSAYIQEILFRAFFFQRYKKLFNNNVLSLVFLNAMIFAYVHIVFENWIAVAFSFVGGLIFAHTYLKTRSTLLTSIEHALYGNTLYTIGLGYYFYHDGLNI